MKIAIYWEQEDIGGVETHLLTLLNNWPKKDDEFILFSHDGNRALKRIAEDLKKMKYVKHVEFNLFSFTVYLQKIKNIPFYNFFKLLGYLIKPLFVVWSIFCCRKLFTKNGPFDVVFSDNGAYPAAWGCLAAIIAAKQLNIQKRILLVHHAATKPEMLWGLFERFMDQKICGAATDLVAVSHATRKTLSNYRWFNTFINPIRVIYNGIEIPVNYKKNTENYDLRKLYQIDENLILVGIVGRIQRYKGHEDLVEGVSFLPREYQKRIKLIFIGPGNDDEIKRLNSIANYLNLENGLLFTDYVSCSSQSLILQLDLLAVMTKDFEGFGLTLAEAMSVKTPVVATKVGAIPEFVNEKVGNLILPESPYEVSRVLKKFIENKAAFTEKAELALNHIKKYSADKIAKHFHMLFNIQ